jgi:hypothetical protein
VYRSDNEGRLQVIPPEPTFTEWPTSRAKPPIAQTTKFFMGCVAGAQHFDARRDYKIAIVELN